MMRRTIRIRPEDDCATGWRATLKAHEHAIERLADIVVKGVTYRRYVIEDGKISHADAVRRAQQVQKDIEAVFNKSADLRHTIEEDGSYPPDVIDAMQQLQWSFQDAIRRAAIAVDRLELVRRQG